jgi:DNA-binding transcriptional MerR regulator
MKIEEVATQFSISSPTLRYYEHEGLLGPVKRVPRHP